MLVQGYRYLTGLILERRHEDGGAFRRLGWFETMFDNSGRGEIMCSWRKVVDSIPGDTGTIATEARRHCHNPRAHLESLFPFCMATGRRKDEDGLAQPCDGVWFLNLEQMVNMRQSGESGYKVGLEWYMEDGNEET
jgi:hypothetical protein